MTQAVVTPDGGRPGQKTLSRNEKTFRQARWPNEVVQVTRMKTRKGLVEFDRKFTGDDDWLKDLTLTIKNVSGKPITFIDASLTLFKKGEADETDKVPVQLPFSYSSAREAGVGGEGERAINPGDSVDIALGEEGYALLQSLLDTNGYPRTFSQVEVAVERVLFNDGTMWYKSFYFLRDPYNPSKWIRDKHFRKGGKYENVKPPGPDGENVPIIYHPHRRSTSSTSTNFLLAHFDPNNSVATGLREYPDLRV